MATERKTMPVFVAQSRYALHADLLALAERLDAPVTDLVWAAIEAYMATDPTERPAGVGSRKGSASGFWITHELDADGRLAAVGVVEVESRSDADGVEFIRYSNPKERGRALRNALEKGQYAAKITGAKWTGAETL